MVIATAYINLKLAVATSGKYTFSYDVHKSIASASSCFILNNGAVQSAPCIVTKRDSGTYVLTYSSTSFYSSASAPMELVTSDPD